MKVLLIPSLDISNGRLCNYIPSGLLLLQAIAAKHNQTRVDIWRPSHDTASRVFRNTDELCAAVLSSIDLDKYTVVGFSTVTSSFLYALRLSETVKSRRSDIAVVLGGPYVTKLHDQILGNFPFLDAVFVGEAEHSFSAFLDRCDDGVVDFAGIPGVATHGGRFTPGTTTDNLDDLPWVSDAPDFLDWYRLRDSDKDRSASIPLEATRGCPLQCSFCSTRQVWGARVRRKSPQRLVEEMKILSDRCGSTFFNLIGDNVGVPRTPFMEFCDEFAAINPGFTWGCSLKLDRLQAEHLTRMWNAGMRAMFIGLESGSQETLDRVRKKTNIDLEVANVRAAVEIGFRVTTSFIIGFPWEELADIKNTHALHAALIQSGVEKSQVNILIPIPGTDIVSDGNLVFENWWSDVMSDGVVSADEIDRITATHPNLFSHYGRYETPHITPKNLMNVALDAAVILKMRNSRSDWNRPGRAQQDWNVF